MQIINKHIIQSLEVINNSEDTFFESIITAIQSDGKNKYIPLLKYIHILINNTLENKTNKLNLIHLHFQFDLDEKALSLIAQYLIILLFKNNIKYSPSSPQAKAKVEAIKKNLLAKQAELITCPEGASGRNGGNRIFKKWKSEKNKVRTLIKFYNEYGNRANISINTVFNCQVQLLNTINDFIANRPYAQNIQIQEDRYPTYSLINTKHTLNQIDEIDSSFIDNLKSLVLFDCERKKLMQYFSVKDVQDYDIKLENYLILSFGNKNDSVHSLEDKLALIQNRFKIPSSTSYPILQSEINFLLERKNKKQIPVNFFGIESSDLWGLFILEINIHDLYELRSIKMMNVYSLCINDEIKRYILSEVFSDKYTSELISDDTKQKLLSLSDEDVLALKESLKNVLDLIINSDFRRVVFDEITTESILIVDKIIINNKKIKSLISSAFSLTPKNKLVTWYDFQNFKKGSILILSYQDPGSFPYYFYPNIIDTAINSDMAVVAIYHKFLFSNRYQWAKYNSLNDLYKITDHRLRKVYFKWDSLENMIYNLKPQTTDGAIWDLEQQYSGSVNRETVKLKLKDEPERTYDSSELFIYSTDNKKTYRVERIGDIVNLLDEDEKCFLHYLDDIQENINLYEKMVDTSQQEEELNIIRQQFEIDENETGRLWKILLKEKAQNTNEEDLYLKLKSYLESKNLKIVSLNYFKNNWLVPESESIAPLNKRVFVELCNFLNLPKIYYTLVQRLKNISKQSSRQSTRQMNRLLQDLFNDGTFDKEIDVRSTISANIKKYTLEHPLEELGIPDKYLGHNLIALVELIKTEVTLKKLESFNKVVQ